MPMYSFTNKETNEEFEEIMSAEARDLFLKNNPNFAQSFKINIGDPVRLGVTKPPADFMKNVIGRIQNSVPQNTLKDTGKFQIPKEI